PAPAAGTLAQVQFQEGSAVKVGQVIGRILPGAAQRPQAAAAPVAAAAPIAVVAPVAAAVSPANGAPQSAHARSISRAPAEDGSLPADRLSPSRRRALREGEPVAPVAARPTPVVAAPAAAEAPKTEREEIVPMTSLRRTIAERLVQAQ